MASNGEESEFYYGIKNNASIVNASPTLIVSKNVDGTYEHTLPGDIPLTSAQITTALGYAPIGANTSMTGLTEGALITINTDTAKFNVSAGTGFIVNGNLAVPTVTPVTIVASTANVIPNLGTQEITYVAIGITGALFLTSAPLTAAERRSYIRLGRIVHSNNTSINAIYNQPTVNKEAGGQVQDILEALGFRSLSGNRVFPVSTNLKIKKEVGRVFKSGSNFATLATQPHSFTLDALDPITFKYRTQTGVEGAAVTDIDPDIYEVNGTITPVGSTATLATIQRIFVSQSNEVRIQPGQRVFTTLNGAVTAINSDVFVTDSDIFENFLYLGAIVLTRNTVDLSNIAQAIFVPAIGVCANGAAPVPALGYTAEDAANKQNSLVVDGTGAKYPTVDAVNSEVVKLTGDQTINGVKSFGDKLILGESSGNQDLIDLPGTNKFFYKETGGKDFDFNIGPDNPNSFFTANTEGVEYQAMYFGDGDSDSNIWGVSSSMNSGLNWQSSIVANTTGKIGINNSNPRYNLDVVGVNRTQGIINSNTEISVSPTEYNVNYISPNLGTTLQQGYASDGVFNYQFGTTRIAKYNFDYSVLVANNTNPLNGIGGGVNHIGSSCILNGLIYAPVDNQSTNPITSEKIAVYNTSDLSLVTTYDISAENAEAASITTDGSILYLFSYYGNGAKIWKYSLTGTFLGYITISTPITFVQGASFYNGLFYVSDQENLYTVTLNGLTTTLLTAAPNAPVVHRAQGLDVVNGQIRWVVINSTSSGYNTYFINPEIGVNKTFTANNNGVIIGGNNSLGGKLDLLLGVTGGGLVNPATIPNGTFSISNGGATVASPTIVTKTENNNTIGFRVISTTQDVNSSADIDLNVRRNNNTDFTTLTTPAFKITRYATELFKVLRNGAATFSSSVTVASLAGNSNASVKVDANGKLITSAGYKVYTALLTQSGTAAPVATVLENTLGGTLVFSRSSAGSYLGTLNGVFTANKTYVMVANTITTGIKTSGYSQSGDTISLFATDASNSGYDGGFFKTSIEIRVYN